MVQEHVKESIHESKRAKVDFNKPEYIAAIFFLSARKFKVAIKSKTCYC